MIRPSTWHPSNWYYLDKSGNIELNGNDDEHQKNIDLLKNFLKEERRRKVIQEMKYDGVIVIEEEMKE